MNVKTQLTLPVSLGLLLGGLIGCGPIEAPPAEEGPASDACEHAAEGPFVDAIAGIGNEDPPDISAEHTAFVVTTADLLDEEGNRGGFVSYASEAAGDYYLFLSDHMDITVWDVNADEVPLEDSVHEVAECDEVTMYHLVELGVGTYDIELGPTSLDEVTIVVVPGGDHAHESE